MEEREEIKFVEPVEAVLAGRQRRFGGPKDVLDFVEKECAFWAFEENEPAPWAGFVSDAATNWRRLKQAAAEYDPSKAAESSQRESLKGRLENTYNRLLPSDDPRAKFVRRHRDQDRTISGHILEYFLDPNRAIGSFLAFKAALLAARFALGIGEDVAESHVRTLTEIQKRWDGFKAEAKRAHEQAHGARAEEHTRLCKNIKETVKDQVATLAESLNVFEERKVELEEQFVKRLALEAPVTYWSKKASRHRNTAWAWGLLGLFALVAIGFVLWKLGAPLLSAEMTDSGTAKPLEYLTLAAYVAAAAFLIWPVRILLKLFMSSVHLATDAKERSIMVETFLSLQKDTKAKMSTDERALMLSAIFRPSAPGLIKDDPSPLVHHEIVKAMGKRT